MLNTSDFSYHRARHFAIITLLGLTSAFCDAAPDIREKESMQSSDNSPTQVKTDILSTRQQAIIPVAAFGSAGAIDKLNTALSEGLDAGLTVNEIKEVLIQLYAYAGFPRSLNALGELMKVLEKRKQQGIEDVLGNLPARAIPEGSALLAAGTLNQTRLSGGPVQGPLFDFAPTINQYLRTHLFGDIFERDNLDWQSRELATLSMLSALQGVDSQIQAHMRIAMNTGLSAGQLRHLTQVLAEHVDEQSAQRAREALEKHLATVAGNK